MYQKEEHCGNFNHRRSDAPVRFCPACGKIVNEKVLIKECIDEIHRKRRKEANHYCVDCGKDLKN